MLTPLSISEENAEALLTGADGVRKELADVARALATLNALAQSDADTDFSGLIAMAAIESRVTPAEHFANSRITMSRDWTARVMPRVAVGLVALFMLVFSTSGLAFAANGSKPGDLLYGLDRAFEVVGIGDGGVDERLDEAQTLVAAGVLPAGLTHAAAVLGGTPASETAKADINAAAARLVSDPPGPDSDVAEKVGNLLSYLHGAATASIGSVNGTTVSELARAIGGGPPGGTPGKSEDAPGQGGDSPSNSENAPGQSENAPGQNKDKDKDKDDDGPGNSENAPGQNKDKDKDDDGPGNSENAPGQNKEDPPGNSGNAPGRNK